MDYVTTPRMAITSTETASEKLQRATEDTYQNHVNAPLGSSTYEAKLEKGLCIWRNILVISRQLHDVSKLPPPTRTCRSGPDHTRQLLANGKVIHLLLWSEQFFSSEIDHIKSMTRCGVKRHRNTKKWAHDPTTRRALAVFLVCELSFLERLLDRATNSSHDYEWSGYGRTDGFMGTSCFDEPEHYYALLVQVLNLGKLLWNERRERVLERSADGLILEEQTRRQKLMSVTRDRGGFAGRVLRFFTATTDHPYTGELKERDHSDNSPNRTDEMQPSAAELTLLDNEGMGRILLGMMDSNTALIMRLVNHSCFVAISKLLRERPFTGIPTRLLGSARSRPLRAGALVCSLLEPSVLSHCKRKGY